MEKLERLLEWGGTRWDVAFLMVSAVALGLSIAGVPLPVDPAWVAIVLCGAPILLEALPLTLEEIFIYELGGEDYAVRDIIL